MRCANGKKSGVKKIISVGFKLPQGVFYAVDDVSLNLHGGNFTAIIGESGCGKSVLGQAILNILPSGVVKKGRVLYNGEQVKKILSAFGIIPQNPSESLNPVRKIGKQMQDILAVHILQMVTIVIKSSACGCSDCRRQSVFLAAYPHELSGGQKQRIGIARALALEPQIIICDEAVSALDVSVQAQVLNLLKKLKDELGLTYIFISHDLSVVKYISDRIIIMYLGRIMEIGDAKEIYANPAHPYTKALFSAIPPVSPYEKKGNDRTQRGNSKSIKYASGMPIRKQMSILYRRM